ncbi:hypothetical protein [Thermaerobacillus caldiproteolyticus]|uniref:Uncharacterized protein n=1 Tax=Thermaerobacillus caldiproteolyticus TaxID=247480 RepID=A0A7V9Z8W2_9BACL|nr:hypothetical protein [Anoxybacillus caldiproteolyticus]MBA2876228.1 hypothetical protein [Anoxybacillus caldiproteolyticus]
MNRHFDKETLKEILTYVEQNCTDLKEVITYITERFEYYWRAGESDKYQTIYGIYSYINKYNHTIALMTVEEIKNYLQGLNSHAQDEEDV